MKDRYGNENLSEGERCKELLERGKEFKISSEEGKELSETLERIGYHPPCNSLGGIISRVATWASIGYLVGKSKHLHSEQV